MMLQKNIFLGYAISSIWNGLLGALLLFGIDFYSILLAVNSPEVAKIFTPRMLVAHGSRLYVYIIYLYIYLSLSLSPLSRLSLSLFFPCLFCRKQRQAEGTEGGAEQDKAGQGRPGHGNSRKSRATKRGRKNNCISSIWKMRLPNLQKLDFASKIWKTHGNLGCQESRTNICINIYYIYIYISLLFENMRLPNLQKARFCTQNREIHGNLGGQEPRNHLNMFYFKKCACATSKKLDFANKITETGRSGAEKPFEYVLF